MGALAAGKVVILPFPFTDLAGQRYRPALLLAGVERGDWIACQITSVAYSDRNAVELGEDAFAEGGLRRVSYVRPGKLFTANEKLFSGVAGTLTANALSRSRDAVIALISDTETRQ